MENEKKPERRRSSFIRGRLSLSRAQMTPSSNICSTVPITLPPAERYLKILELCYKQAAEETSQKLFPDDEVKQQTVAEKMKEGFEDMKDTLKAKKLCEAATNVNTDDTSDKLEDGEIKAYKEYINRLREESNTWDEIIKKETELLSTQQEIARKSPPPPENHTTITIPNDNPQNNLRSKIHNMKKRLCIELDNAEEQCILLNGIKTICEQRKKYYMSTIDSAYFYDVDDNSRSDESFYRNWIKNLSVYKP